MIDLNELKTALSEMKPRQQLYETIKAEMKKRRRWKQLTRGRHVDKNKEDLNKEEQ